VGGAGGPTLSRVDEAPDEPIEVVLSVGALDATVVALREFLHRGHAVQVQALVDRGPEEPAALITCGRLEPIEVVRGEHVVHLPHAVDLDPAPPDTTAVPAVPPVPPLDVDAEAGTITGPLGRVEAAAHAVEALARHLGGRSVVMAFYPTTAPDLPLGIASRPGEPTVITIGDQQFGLPD
jgi:hypothetical protein